jgi:pyrimidine-nucleoside phosphorylase
MKADDIGRASMILGAGRQKKNDTIDLAAGVLLNKKVGDKINKGDVIAWIYTNRQDAVLEARDILRKAIHIEEAPSDERPLIFGLIDSKGQYTEY